MKKIVYLLRYADGNYVQRDDSTGPMSTGGYPFPVDDVERATQWSDPQKAASYANVCGWRDMDRRVYQYEVTLTMTGEYLEYPPIWVECNHHCVKTPESNAAGALHYLDCPIRND